MAWQEIAYKLRPINYSISGVFNTKILDPTFLEAVASLGLVVSLSQSVR